MVRVQTNVLCDKDLKDQAKARKISLSDTLEEAIREKLSLPTKGPEIKQKIAELEAQIKYMQSYEFREAEKEFEREDKLAAMQKKKDESLLRKAFVNSLQNQNKDKYNKILHAYCEKYKVEMVVAVALAESKPKEAEGKA